MRLAEPGLLRKQRDAQSSALNSAQQLHTQAFVHLGKSHVWKVRHEPSAQPITVFFEQTDLRQFGFILLGGLNFQQNESGIMPGGVDSEDTYL